MLNKVSNYTEVDYRFNCFYDEPDPQPDSQPDPQPDPQPALQNKDTDALNFTEAQLAYVKNLEEKNKKNEEQTRKTISELNALRNKQNVSTEDKEKLTARINELDRSLLTEKELAARDKKDLKERHAAQLKQEQEQTSLYRNLYTDTMINKELLAAATDPEHEAFNPKQLVSLLKPNSKLVQKANESGELINDFEVKVEIDSIDKDNKPITLSLTPKEAVKHMFAQQINANLFKFNGKSGVGFKQETSHTINASELSTGEYFQARKTGAIKFGEK